MVLPFTFKFWGVRGSIACPSGDLAGYGGNTSCLEVRIGDSCLIFDAGTGIRELGQKIIREGTRKFDILLTHTHWDHICGFPFFQPAFDPRFQFTVRCGNHPTWARPPTQEVFSDQMLTPLFPVPLEALQAQIRWEDFTVGSELDILDKVRIRTAPLNHPSGATAYRLDYGGQSLCYVTDTEHVVDRRDSNILDLVKDASVMIYDTTYTDEEFPSRVSWGHSTWEEGVRLCQAARVKTLFLFHHDSDRTDQQMEELEAQARQVWSGVYAAREGMTVRLVG